MSGWLDALRAALDTRPTPVWFFFRDDDAGWDDTALEALLDVFEPHGLPLDVATIPLAATSRTGEVITTRQTGGRNHLRVHQHGLAHVNHEPAVRACELGVVAPPSSSATTSRPAVPCPRVVRGGAGDLPASVEPVRPRTVDVVRDLGFAVLSRDPFAGTAGVPWLVELPVTGDWFGKWNVSLDQDAQGELLAAMAGGQAPVGVMLHHAIMSAHDRTHLGELLASPVIGCPNL